MAVITIFNKKKITEPGATRAAPATVMPVLCHASGLGRAGPLSSHQPLGSCPHARASDTCRCHTPALVLSAAAAPPAGDAPPSWSRLPPPRPVRRPSQTPPCPPPPCPRWVRTIATVPYARAMPTTIVLRVPGHARLALRLALGRVEGRRPAERDYVRRMLRTQG